MLILYIMIVLLSILLLFLGVHLLFLKKEIRHINLQFLKIMKQSTNAHITKEYIDKDTIQLIQTINQFIDQTRQIEMKSKESNEVLKSTILNMSHDLRTPLTSIQGYLQLINMEEIDAKKRKEYILNGGIIMKLVPLGDRVVLKQVEAEETTKSGLILTTSAQEKPQEAEVIAVGPGGMVDGKEVTMQVKPGDKVIYSKYAGNEVKLEGEEYIIVRQNDILAVVE